MAPPEHQDRADEERPLLTAHHGERGSYNNSDGHEPQKVTFSEEDDDDPKQWNSRKKLMNVFIIAFMAIVSPLASSMYTPGIQQIADEFGVSMDAVIATTTGYVIFMGIGPLILAPLSETFGRRKIYIICFAIFSLQTSIHLSWVYQGAASYWNLMIWIWMHHASSVLFIEAFQFPCVPMSKQGWTLAYKIWADPQNQLDWSTYMQAYYRTTVRARIYITFFLRRTAKLVLCWYIEFQIINAAA